MLETYLNAIWVMECEHHKRMMKYIDKSVENLYLEFEVNSIFMHEKNISSLCCSNENIV